MNCKRCNDTGVYETGNNDEPCDCPAGDTAEFNVCKPGGGLRVVTGAELRREQIRRELGPLVSSDTSSNPVGSNRG